MDITRTQCPFCEFPLQTAGQVCPKCGETSRGQAILGLLEVDVAHSGETWDMAHEKIIIAVDRGILLGHSGVKIIHGWGASTGKSVISGRAIRLLESLAGRTGGKLTKDRHNPGAHILWLNR
ncbi:MAG: hypothetical protein JNJ83_24710 [Verrucomicrobiaceae bacterium]|nr:hypothetical protein [Verrucomicrobiaceae bacterium]